MHLDSEAWFPSPYFPQKLYRRLLELAEELRNVLIPVSDLVSLFSVIAEVVKGKGP